MRASGALGCILLSACLVACETRSIDMERLARADHAEVRSNHDQLLASLDQERTRRVAALLSDETQGWEEPWYGTPVATVSVRFLEGGKSLGSVGVGDSFLTAGPAHLLSKDVAKGKCEAILAAAGIAR